MGLNEKLDSAFNSLNKSTKAKVVVGSTIAILATGTVLSYFSDASSAIKKASDQFFGKAKSTATLTFEGKTDNYKTNANKYEVTLKDKDENPVGTIVQPDNIATFQNLPTPVEQGKNPNVPKSFKLYQNFPNAFDNRTTLQFDVKEMADFLIEIYNIMGQKVRTIESKKAQPGTYRLHWDAKNEHGREVSDGIYIARMKAGKY